MAHPSSFTVLVLAALCILLASCVEADWGLRGRRDSLLADGGPARADPANSWLAYTKNAGNNSLVTYVEATWTVPAFPAVNFGSNAPGFWFGIEPVPATNLIQPILAWADGAPRYTIFNGYFDWHGMKWQQSASIEVQPGNTIFANVTYRNDTKPTSYDMYIECRDTGKFVKTNIAVDAGLVYTDTYFVLEHQPRSCDAYPANGNVTFTNIKIQMNYQWVTPSWQAYTYKPACDSEPHVLSPTSVQFTWDTTGKSRLTADDKHN